MTVIEYDPTSWDTQVDPYPSYQRLRDKAPVYQNEKLGFWALSRFEDVWDAHLDAETFSSKHGPTLEKLATPFPILVGTDPPKHTRMRQLVSKAFTPRRIAELEPTVREITESRLEGLQPGEEIGARDEVLLLVGARRRRPRYLRGERPRSRAALRRVAQPELRPGKARGHWAPRSEFTHHLLSNVAPKTQPVLPMPGWNEVPGREVPSRM